MWIHKATGIAYEFLMFEERKGVTYIIVTDGVEDYACAYVRSEWS